MRRITNLDTNNKIKTNLKDFVKTEGQREYAKMTIRIDRELLQHFKLLITQVDISMNTIVVNLIENFVNENKSK